MQEVARRLYPINEAATQLGIGRSKVYELMSSGELESVSIGRRTLIPAGSIDRYIERLTGQAS